ANLRKLMRRAREFEADEGRDLSGFLDFVSFQTGEDDEAVAATEAEDHDGVRVMTIHTAKGLEFPVVAVGGLGRDLLRGGRAPERAAELVRIASAKPAEVELAGGPPPIVERRVPVAPRRPLSYTALRRHRRCGYRFYAETVLGLAQVDMKGSAIGRQASQEFGDAVHGLLEWSASRRWIDPPPEVTRRFLAARGV